MTIRCIPLVFILTGFSLFVYSQEALILVDLNQKHQIIDGFGAHQGNGDVNQNWWQELYYEDLRASIYRVDLTPQLIAPYSDLSVYSPWFMGSGTDSVFNLEDPDNPNGPEDNRVRTYTGPDDYSRLFGGLHAPIAVMGPDIDENVGYFQYAPDGAISEGMANAAQLGDFKLIGSLWSPLPWVKVSSGNSWSQNWWPGPVFGAEWPFIWGGNYAGGMLDVSDTPLEVFDDAALGGTGPTSALTQFARSTAAYILGYQEFHNVSFYAISIQNELNFEQFYNSATYPLSQQYIKAVKVLREEFDKYPALENILIMGPEDLLGGDAYGMWQYGGASDPTHKNLQYLQNIAADPEAADAVDFFCIHGYGSDGVSVAGANSVLWDWWVNGWQSSPAAGIPGNVAGFSAFGKKSWMTETSGENPAWIWPQSGYPSDGGWSLGLRIHQALTTGMESAWIYWTFTENGDNGDPSSFALTNQALGNQSPKYVAAKHFFRYIRPNAFRVQANISENEFIEASAYIHETDGTITLVLINTSETAQDVKIKIPGMSDPNALYESYTSSENNFWQAAPLSFQNGQAETSIPGYGICTIYGANDWMTSLATACCPPNSAAFRISPNPASSQCTVSFTLIQSQDVTLELLDKTGKIVNSQHWKLLPAGLNERTIETQNLPDGIYFFRLTQSDSTHSQKVFIHQ